MERINGIIRLIYTIKRVRDVMIDWQFSLHILFYKLRNISPRFEPAECSSFPGATSHQLERPSRDHMARSGNANDARCAPPTMRALQRCTHDFYVPCAIKGVVNTPRSHCAGNVLLYFFITERCGINTICCAESFRRIELFRVYINGDNFTRSSCLGALDHGQTHSSKSKDSNGTVHLNRACVPYSTKTSRDTASKQADLIQGCIQLNLGT
mmetsp:Transcript_2280/g.3362  ORF Transcript_2280/g.3362 Transcript_2280/m.3362 type:complete len:211 (+) Transcript_2280:304-936(+)